MLDAINEENFKEIKNELQNANGITYNNYKRTLKPIYAKVWLDVITGWALLSATFAFEYFLINTNQNIFLQIIIANSFSIIGGYWIAYLVNFLHEAAHYNIATKKNTNDLLCNIFIGVLTGQSIKSYRPIHWMHHKFLGTPNDTEVSYHDSLSVKFIIESLFGIRVLRVISNRNKINNKENNNLPLEKWIVLLYALLFHAIIVSLFIIKLNWIVAISWLLSVVSFYPLFNSLRQLLEHRNENADKNIDYKTTTHGKITRIFGNDLLDKTFGSAGFNKHLLHHLEPQVSYTRLKELEQFLLNTQLADNIKKQLTHYPKTFIKLLNK